jgi:hypothetical protein
MSQRLLRVRLSEASPWAAFSEETARARAGGARRREVKGERRADGRQQRAGRLCGRCRQVASEEPFKRGCSRRSLFCPLSAHSACACAENSARCSLVGYNSHAARRRPLMTPLRPGALHPLRPRHTRCIPYCASQSTTPGGPPRIRPWPSLRLRLCRAIPFWPRRAVAGLRALLRLCAQKSSGRRSNRVTATLRVAAQRSKYRTGPCRRHAICQRSTTRSRPLFSLRASRAEPREGSAVCPLACVWHLVARRSVSGRGSRSRHAIPHAWLAQVPAACAWRVCPTRSDIVRR